MHNLKNSYHQSDSKVIVEFETEADLFDAYEHAIYFGQFKIQGTPRNYPYWIYNKKPFIKPLIILPFNQDNTSRKSEETSNSLQLTPQVPMKGPLLNSNPTAMLSFNEKLIIHTILEEKLVQVHPDRLRNFIYKDTREYLVIQDTTKMTPAQDKK